MTPEAASISLPDPWLADCDCSGFLGGRLRLWQPKSGYRGGIDPVLLAAATPAKAGESVLEFGTGAGTASLCLGARVSGLKLTGIELQPLYAALARLNAAENALPLTVHQADIGALPAEVRAQSYDHVIANPPYFRPEGRTEALDPGREIGRGEQRALADWVHFGLKRLRQGGTLTLIQVMPRLPDLLKALPEGGTVVQPFAPREGREADRLILWHRKGGRADFRLLPPLILHSGAAHLRDGDDYAPWASAVLRRGEMLQVHQ